MTSDMVLPFIIIRGVLPFTATLMVRATSKQTRKATFTSTAQSYIAAEIPSSQTGNPQRQKPGNGAAH